MTTNRGHKVLVRKPGLWNYNASGDSSTTGNVDGLDGFTGGVDVAMTWNETTEQREGFLELRAERDGEEDQGRKYSFSCLVADLSGNYTEATICVLVPHDKIN